MNNKTIPSSGSHKVTNEVIFNLIVERITDSSRILDFGAGAGYMCAKVGDYLSAKGVAPAQRLNACEITPEKFLYEEVECQEISTNSVIPFDDSTFDLIYSIEVLEHTPRPYDFFAEAFRKLRGGGHLIFSVPNILHMKSRLGFLFTGFGDMFGPPSTLDKNAGRICGHIMPLNYSHFHYGLKRAGFEDIKFFVDRRKRSSLFLALLFYPFLRIGTGRYNRSLMEYDMEVWEENREVVSEMNSLDMLSSRSCILVARKP